MQRVWVLHDLFDDDPDPCEAVQVPISTAEELRKELAALAALKPRIVELESPNGTVIRLGISGPHGGLAIVALVPSRYVGVPARMELRIALARTAALQDRVEFLCGQQPCTLHARSLFPAAELIELVTAYYEVGQFPDWLVWDTSLYP